MKKLYRKRVHTVGFHLYEILYLAELIYGEKTTVVTSRGYGDWEGT